MLGVASRLAARLTLEAADGVFEVTSSAGDFHGYGCRASVVARRPSMPPRFSNPSMVLPAGLPNKLLSAGTCYSRAAVVVDRSVRENFVPRRTSSREPSRSAERRSMSSFWSRPVPTGPTVTAFRGMLESANSTHHVFIERVFHAWERNLAP
jgi:hypothetical protein